MSFEASAWALHQRCPTATAKLVLLGLASHASADGSGAWPSVETLSLYSDASRRTVQRALRSLEESGLILRSPEQPLHIPIDRRPVSYDLTMPGRQSVTPDEDRGVTGDAGGASPVTDRGVTGDALTVQEPPCEPPTETPTSVVPTSVDEVPRHRMDPETVWTADVVALTREFASMVQANGHGLPTKGTRAADGWFAAFDKLVRIGPPGDGVGAVPVDEIREVMRWALQVSDFWPANIRSGPKFREQFTRLRAAARRENGGGRRPDGISLAEGYEAAAAALRSRRGRP